MKAVKSVEGSHSLLKAVTV